MTIIQYSMTLPLAHEFKVRMENIRNRRKRNCRIGKITLKSA